MRADGGQRRIHLVAGGVVLGGCELPYGFLTSDSGHAGAVCQRCQRALERLVAKTAVHVACMDNYVGAFLSYDAAVKHIASQHLVAPSSVRRHLRASRAGGKVGTIVGKDANSRGITYGIGTVEQIAALGFPTQPDEQEAS